ncbi:MAG TPA: DNA-binding response regulator, partial [Bacillales bacterium]
MSLTLSRQMQAVLQNGLNIVREHRQLILSEWEKISIYLNKTREKSVYELDETINFFSECLFSENQEEMEDLFKNLDQQWNRRFSGPFRPNHHIFIITLLENAAHEAI